MFNCICSYINFFPKAITDLLLVTIAVTAFSVSSSVKIKIKNSK